MTDNKDPDKAQRLPEIPRELLEALERRFPDRFPCDGEPVDEIRAMGGLIKLLRFLRTHYEMQQVRVGPYMGAESGPEISVED